ncbi:hypothetical protein L3Q82_007801 [Scortum barcoo]|uniref:Uncharacterized protein n=1 Tax=Scortum barcoo TaxID=214431 RepID=A0ACB8WJF8_9TELE|nr:hypothetical protein L3Q82_007801 [Scortum barcoo]
MMGEIVAMHREQAAAKHQLEALHMQTEQQTELLQDLLTRANAAPAPLSSPSLHAVTLHKMGEADGPQMFVEIFETTAAACGWPMAEWAVRHGFREARLRSTDRPFIFAQQLREAATRWLQPGESAGEGRMLELVNLKQFVEGLLAGTSKWMRCRHLAPAVTLAEDHLAVHPSD